MRKVYICSPYRAKESAELDRNIDYAQLPTKQALQAGHEKSNTEAKAWDYAKACACHFCKGSRLHTCTGYDCREPYIKAFEYAMLHSNLL